MFRTRLVVVFVLSIAVVATFGARSAAAQQAPDFGTLLIQVRPPNAEILIDGVQWPASETADPLKLQLAAGTHKVEVRAPGHQTFVQDVSIRAGETVPLNVLLSASATSDRPKVSPPPPAPPPPPRPRVTPPQPQPSGPSSIKFVPNDDGFMFAPDVRFTEINGRAGTLIGAYGGMTYGGKFFVGAGAYFQVDGYNGRQMNYFGPVFEYRLFDTKTIGLNAHALVGGGVAYGNCCYPVYGPYYGPYPYGYNNAFFVFEPEAQLVVRFSPIVRLQVGLGYRVAGYSLDGVSGSVSVQFGK